MNPQDCVWKNLYRINHEDHIAGRGDNSLQHFNLVHKFIPMPQAQRKQQWIKNGRDLKKIPAWEVTKVRSKKEVIDEARTKGSKVHFVSLMNICHLKNAKLETKHQKNKGRVALRGDIVKDGSDLMQYLQNKDHQHHK